MRSGVSPFILYNPSETTWLRVLNLGLFHPDLSFHLAVIPRQGWSRPSMLLNFSDFMRDGYVLTSAFFVNRFLNRIEAPVFDLKPVDSLASLARHSSTS